MAYLHVDMVQYYTSQIPNSGQIVRTDNMFNLCHAIHQDKANFTFKPIYEHLRYS